MKRPIRKRVWYWAGIVLVVAGAVVAWRVYDSRYRIPQGPALPPQPEPKEFSVEVTALDNQAIDVYSSDPEAALALYDQAICLDPDYYPAYVNKGQLLMQRQDYGKAAACYARATSLRPRVAEFYVAHAYCLDQLGQTDEAQSQLMFALSAYNSRIDKSPMWTRLNRALVLFLLRRDELVDHELGRLRSKYTDDASRQVISAFQAKIDKTRSGDRWSVVFPKR